MIGERLRPVSDALSAKGFPATSAWWLDTLTGFYASPARQLVLRVGRRGGKSSTLCRVAVLEAVYGQHKIPPGDVGVVAIVSVSRDQSAERLKTCRAILDALRIRYHADATTVILDGKRVAIKTFAATMSGVVGFTGICAICDEVSYWRDADTGANPATQVLASLRPTLATQPNARIFLSSSPLGRLDAHARAFDQGGGTFQQVAHAPSWVANPTLTEAYTHTLEEDEDRWKREYAAIPLETDESSLLSAGLVDRATRRLNACSSVDLSARLLATDEPPSPLCSYVAAMDPGFVRNPWTFVICAKRWVGGKIKRSVVLSRQWRGTASKPLEPERVLLEIAPFCRLYRCDGVHSDQYEKYGLQDIAKRPGIDLGIWPETRTSVQKLASYEQMQQWLSDDEVELPDDPVVRGDLLAIRQRLTANGFTIQLPETADGRHADYAPAIVLGLGYALIDPDPELPALGTVEYGKLLETQWMADTEGRLLREAEDRLKEARNDQAY
jgi:hypothetical protein